MIVELRASICARYTTIRTEDRVVFHKLNYRLRCKCRCLDDIVQKWL